MADEQIRIDVSQALSEISKLKGGMADAQAQAAKTGRAISQAMNPEAAKGVADAVGDLVKEYGDLKRSADTLKSALRGATDPAAIKLYARSVAELELGMKQLEKTGKAAGVNLKEANKAAGAGKEVFGALFGAFTKASIILFAVDAVRQLVVASVQLSEQLRTARVSFQAFTGSAEKADKIVESLIATSQKNFLDVDQVLKAGKALLAFGEDADDIPRVLDRLANASAATGKDFNELVTIYGKARVAGVLYAEDINQLVEAGIPIIQEFADQMGVSNEQVKKLASDGKISFEELQLAMFNLNQEGALFAGQTEVAGQSLEGLSKKLQNSLQPALKNTGDFFSGIARSTLKATQGVIDFAKAFAAVTIAGAGVYRAKSNEAKEDEAYAASRRLYESQLDESVELQEAAEKKRSLLADKSGANNSKKAAQNEKERQQAIIDAMREGVEKQVAQENLRFKILEKELKRFHIDTSEAEAQHQENIADIYAKEADRIKKNVEIGLDIRRKIYEKEGEVIKKEQDDKKAAFDKEVQRLTDVKNLKDLELDLSEENGKAFISALRAQGKDEEAIKEAQVMIDLQLQKARLQNELDFQTALIAITDAGNTKQINETLAKIEILKAKIQNIESAPGAPSEKKGKGILERLGFDEENIEGLEKAKDQIIGYLQEIAQANVERTEKDLELAQERVEKAQSELDEQNELKKQGFANDVALSEQRLAQAKADEQKALEERRKAQRQQLILDSALQFSSIATAAAQILRGWSALPFVGQVLGAIAVGAMISSFIAVKAKAFQATKYRHGGEGRVNESGVIQGKSHDEGGVHIEAEGGEFFASDGKKFSIVKREMTAKHFNLLKAVNNDDRAGMLRAVSAIALNKNSVGRAISDTYYLGGGESGTTSRETLSLLKDWKKESKGKRQIYNDGGYRVETQGNYTRKTKIAK